MKNIFGLSLLMLLIVASCKKGELADSFLKVVNLQLTGKTSAHLEFLYKGDVVALAEPGSDGFDKRLLLDVGAQAEDIQVRDAASGRIVQTTAVNPSPFEQTITIYYDGTNSYSEAITYKIEGFAMSGDLEFILDDELVGEGTSEIALALTIYLNENDTKNLYVRKKGETDVLVTETIDGAADGNTLRFFFDGTSLIDAIPQLEPPANPANMSITGQFTTVMTPTADMGGVFTGDAEVDLVFYIRNTSEVVTIPNPELRFTVPTDGQFVTFELPPLPDQESFYTYDICKKGSDDMPYKDFSLPDIFPPGLNKGQAGQLVLGENGSFFQPGASKLVLLQDASSLSSDFTYRLFHGQIMDLSQYFK